MDIPGVLWGYCLVELGGRPSLALSFETRYQYGQEIQREKMQ